MHGYDELSLAALRRVGWTVRDITSVDAAAIMKQVRGLTVTVTLTLTLKP